MLSYEIFYLLFKAFVLLATQKKTKFLSALPKFFCPAFSHLSSFNVCTPLQILPT